MRLKSFLFFVFAISIATQAQTKVWSIYDCVSYAVENNISLQQQNLNSELSEEDIKSAKGNFYPDLNATANQSWDFGSSIGVLGTRTSNDRRGNYFGINTNVTLFNGFQNRNNLEQTRLGLASNQYQFDILKDDITIRILSGYIDILAQKENLKIAQEQVKISEQNIEQMQSFVDAGTRAKADLLDLKSQLATDQQALVNAESNLTMSKVNLAEILQISYVGFDIEEVNLDLSSVSLVYNNAEEIYNKAVQNRAEILRAQNEIERSGVNTEIAKGAYYPSLTFGAGYGTVYQHFQGVPDDNNNILQPEFGKQLENNLNLNAVFTLRIPIFNRMQTRVNVNRSKINEQIAENELAQQKQTLLSNVVRVYTDARNSLDQFRASEASLEAQTEAFENAKDSFDYGVMTSFEFEQIRLRFLNAQSAFVNAKYNFIFRTKALEYYTGVPIAIN